MTKEVSSAAPVMVALFCPSLLTLSSERIQKHLNSQVSVRICVQYAICTAHQRGHPDNLLLCREPAGLDVVLHAVRQQACTIQINITIKKIGYQRLPSEMHEMLTCL